MRNLFYGENIDAFVEEGFSRYDAMQDTSFLSSTLFEGSSKMCIRNLGALLPSNKRSVELFFKQSGPDITLIEHSKPTAEYGKLLAKYGFELTDTGIKNSGKGGDREGQGNNIPFLTDKLYEFTKNLGAQVDRRVISELIQKTGSYEYAKNQLTVLCMGKGSVEPGDTSHLWFPDLDPSFFDSKNYIYNPTPGYRKNFNLNMFTGAVGYFALNDCKTKKKNIYRKFLEAELLFKSGKLRSENDYFLWLEAKKNK